MNTRKLLNIGFFVVCFVLVVVLVTVAQQPVTRTQKQAGAATNAQVARGRYIVHEVAKCINCHTPRDGRGNLDYSKLLMGAAVYYQPAQPMPDWPQTCPRIGGTPPGTDQDFINLMMTGIWNTGKPLRDPMPQFHMTREDAEAVLAYLKSMK